MVYRNNQNRGANTVKRGDELTLENPVDGMFFDELMSCSTQDALVAFYLEGTTHPFIEMIPKTNTDLYRVSEAFLQYVAADGTAAGTPSTAAIANPCEAGNTFENGFVHWTCEGFTRLRRSTKVRDITDRGIKLCETIPMFDIAGNRITDDFEWDAFRLGNVLMQDFHSAFLLANEANAGETNGLLAQIDYGYTDPVTGIDHPEMDSWVFDWNGSAVCDFTDGTTGVTLNGVALSTDINANLTLISMLRSYTRRVATLIDMSSVSGSYNFVALADPQLIRCIIDCWVCETRCGRDVVRMDSFESRGILSALHSRLGSQGAVTLDFDGHTITFMEWTKGGLYDSGTGLYSMIVLVPKIGNYNAWELQFKDFRKSIDGLVADYKEWMVADNNRWLHWAQIDHTCYQRTSEMQYRMCGRARWTALKVENILCATDAFGRISSDPADIDFLGRGLVGGVNLDPADTYVPFVLRN